ncbi:MAG TPA: protein kinase, partial [Polyangiaceae bacterium]|nr:protein kinase [Polyangiaceae bacterium]
MPSRFRLLEHLGSGGMGSVYRAFDRDLKHEVALKTMHGMSPEDRLRLKREFRALAHIVHPNLVNLYELVADERWCFFTMELVSGVDFVEYTRGVEAARTDPETFVRRLRDAGTQLASALQALHLGGKLHRDVKPS